MNPKRSQKFNVSPIMRKFHPLEKPSLRKDRAAQRSRSTVAGGSAHSNLHTVIALCLIVLLLVVNVILRFPDLGVIIAQYNQY
jgi:hypothetical protein